MRGKLWFGAATAALMLFTPALAQTADPAGDASTTARLTPGAAVEGELSPVGDIDWFRLRVERGQRYTLTLDAVPNEDGSGLDPTLGVYDAQGNMLAFNDDAYGLNSAVAYAPGESGEVFVEARAFIDASEGRYVLGVSAEALPPDDAGNDRSTRARASVGRTVTGNLEYEGDVDWYRFSARTGNRYRITLAGDGASPVGDPLLRILDGEGNQLAGNDDDGESLNSAVDFVPRQNGDVFIEARAFADAYTGGYALNIASERLPPDNASSDRNTRGRINVGQSVAGTLDFPGDTDWFRIRLEEGQSYRFMLNSADDVLTDPLLRVFGPNGDPLAIDDDGGEGFNAYLEFTAPATGSYYLEARGFAEYATGAYTLAAAAGDIPADTSTDVSLSADGDYREGVLSPAGDRDWFRIQLADGQSLRMAMVSAEGPDAVGDPYLVLYGPDGAEVARDDDGGEGLNAWLEYTAPAAGAYYLEARGFSPDEAGRYVIGILPGEIGDNPDGAEYLAPNFEGRTSIIGAPGDVDWFTIEMIEGRPYRFWLTGVGDPDPLADPVLRLYDFQGNEVAIDDDGGIGLSSYIYFTAVTGGPYFAAVSSYGEEGTGRYFLRVADTDVPGHVETDEYLDAANGDERLGRIDVRGDLDYFRVDLEAGARYTIELRGTGDDPLADPFVSIVNYANNGLASDDDSGPGLDARLRFTPNESGTYFIQASGLGGSTGGYQVTIVRQ